MIFLFYSSSHNLTSKKKLKKNIIEEVDEDTYYVCNEKPLRKFINSGKHREKKVKNQISRKKYLKKMKFGRFFQKVSRFYNLPLK